ncbi:hypothetical protein M0Q97_04465 [Candidatus Dojkabacteria bacterium]|jgi:hypothetical protein|nr:hypothetical protein [Candidatus Dojkabacteria bacterium]
MKNILGHDNESEIITILTKLRENKFNVISFDDNTIIFEIVLKYSITVPIPSTWTQKIQYTINRYSIGNKFNYYIKQLNGIDNRLIPFIDGYFIWVLLEESVIGL